MCVCVVHACVYIQVPAACALSSYELHVCPLVCGASAKYIGLIIAFTPQSHGHKCMFHIMECYIINIDINNILTL